MLRKEPDLELLPAVQEIFAPVFEEYGFELLPEEKQISYQTSVVAKKGDIELIFYLESTYRFYLCSIEIGLTGELGEKVSSDPRYRSIGASVIAERLNPGYESPVKHILTKGQLYRTLEADKAELLTYCKEILLGDITPWQAALKSILDENKRSGFKLADY
jgi:hypothetical protein